MRLSGGTTAMFTAANVLICALGVTGCIGQPPVPVTRSDLALALIEFETTVANHPITPGGAEAVNRDFDRATLAFFSGSFGEVIRQLNDLRRRLIEPQSQPADLIAGSLKVRIDPPVWIVGSSAKPVARITHMFELAASKATLPFVLRLRSSAGAVVFERGFSVEAGPTTRVDQSISLDASEIPAGLYYMEIAPRGGTGVVTGRWLAAARSLDANRRENDARLEKLEKALSASGELADAVVNARGRNGLLSDRPSEDALAEWLTDLPALSKQLQNELAALEAGRNPYRRLTGDHWRSLKLGGGQVPCRVFAPAMAAGDEPRPLMIALHGAGGDENMFMDAYGRGLIKSLAEKNGFIVASPLTYPFLLNPALANELADVVGRDYAIDRSRVYVVGHSLGGGAASRIARERMGLAAAVCCIAGGDFNGATKSTPALIFGGELDPIGDPRDLKRGASAASAAGLSVEYRQVEDYGHTLMVDKVLPDAVQWLLNQRLESPSTRPRSHRSR